MLPPPTSGIDAGSGKAPSAHWLEVFAANTAGRDFVVGDVHGHFELLEGLLEIIGFSPLVDRMFCTGDLIDRGPHSAQIVQWLDYPWFHAVRGNHEQMVLDYMQGMGDAPRHARNGGAWFYDLAPQAQLCIANAIDSMPLAIEVRLGDCNAIGVIHAECPDWEKGLSWQQSTRLLAAADQSEQSAALMQAMYARGKITRQDPACIPGIEAVYVGHSTVPQVTRHGNVIYLDTGCSFADGHLTAIDVTSGQVSNIFPLPPARIS